MVVVRSSFAVRALAVVCLLAWTAADLTADVMGFDLCVLEEEQAHEGGFHDEEKHVPSSMLAGATPASSPGTPAQAPHVDDCFCCSHCVEPTSLTPPMTLSLAERREPARRLGFIEDRANDLFHPPQLLA